MWRRRVPALSGGVVLMEERNLLAQFTGDSGGQRLQADQSNLPSPSPTLGLCLGSEQELPDHGRAAQRAQAAACPCPCPSTSRLPFACPRVSVVVPGRPAAAPPQAGIVETRDRGALSDVLPRRPSVAAAAGVPNLEPIYLTTTTTPTIREQCRCDASSLCARVMRGLAGDLDRARAQVALLTCENESLRHRLKRAVAGATETAAPSAAAAPSTTRRLHAAGGLRCRACRVRPATVVLLPREHLCLCARCSVACRHDPAIACWVCRGAAERAGHPPAAPR